MPTRPRSPLIRIAAAAALVAGVAVLAIVIFGAGSPYITATDYSKKGG
jgi:hypothetical protein